MQNQDKYVLQSSNSLKIFKNVSNRPGMKRSKSINLIESIERNIEKSIFDHL